MTIEVFGNNAVSYLAEEVDNSTDPVTFSVDNGSLFPQTGNFRIVIDAEILLVTTVSGNDLTAVRAQEGTQIAGHETGTTVKHVMTAGGLNQALDDSVVVSSYSALPPAARGGRAAFTADDRVMFFSDGSDWLPFGPLTWFTTPVLADFQWDRQVTNTATQNGSYITFSSFDNTANARSVMYKTAMSAPFKLTIVFSINQRNLSTFGAFGIAQRESSSGKLETWEQASRGLTGVGVHQWNSTSSINASIYGWVSYDEPTYLRFMQIHDDNSNVYYNYSYDGLTWYTAYTRARTSFMTADQYGIVLGNGLYSSNLFSFKEEPA